LGKHRPDGAPQCRCREDYIRKQRHRKPNVAEKPLHTGATCTRCVRVLQSRTRFADAAGPPQQVYPRVHRESVTGQIADSAHSLQRAPTSQAIGVASQAIHHGFDSINPSVNKQDAMAQRNAALVEQSAAAAECLKDRALELAERAEPIRRIR